ncbi:MAG: UDP-N-acetylmuramate--L-alanine ligase [Bifidobacterium mongoliense]|uniref:UDP-N-acetylmuramate--L-alanine ligase n=1 Tax=Bifidobacterium mongoliense TaxID=518643 RepID=UPI002F35EB43
MSQTANDIRLTPLDPTVDAFDAHAHVADLGPTHFIGIGGAGMSVLAEMLHEEGVEVRGSDRERNDKTKRLETLGIEVRIGQRAENVAGADTVVYSSAIKPSNPEIVAARAAGVRIVHRSDILALLMHDRRTVTVAGAHGKTTTSSMIAHILHEAGSGALADPSYAIGGSIQEPGGGVGDGGHAGSGDVLVAEADESDGSFAKYRPDIAVVTNVEADHLDHYGTAEAYRHAFVGHIGHARRRIMLCGDDAGALAVLRAVDAQVAARTVVYSTHTAEELGDLNGARLVRIVSESESAGSGTEHCTLEVPAGIFDGHDDMLRIAIALRVPGLHNARNAAAAVLAAVDLGMEPDKAAGALSTFLGASRRFQIRGVEKGVTVVDDYAHHPTEIAALLDAARRRYPTSRIHVLFQPHLFSRTRFFAGEFAQALAKADDVIVTGIFPARERQEDYPDITGATICDQAKALAHTSREDWIRDVEDMQVAAQMIALRAHHGDVIITVGAGDITAMVPVVLHALEAHRDTCEA